MSGSCHPVLTIGHSTHALKTLVELLKANTVAALADIRSSPFSRFTPQFNRGTLEKSLVAEGIKYVFLGRELGGRAADPSCYENGRVQYQRMAGTEVFRGGIERVLRGATKQRIALLCAEKEPLDCHRTLLVAPALLNAGVMVDHILADGRVETHAAAMMRLLGLLGMPQADILRSTAELVEEALQRQAARVAYVDERLVGKATSGGR